MANNEFYNHLAFNLFEDFQQYLLRKDLKNPSWLFLITAIYMNKFKHFEYLNLSMSNIYEITDRISTLNFEKQYSKQKPDEILLNLLYLETRILQNSTLKLSLDEIKKHFSIDILIVEEDYNQLLTIGLLLKILSLETQYPKYDKYLLEVKELLRQRYPKNNMSVLIFKKMLLLFDGETKFVSKNFLKQFITNHKNDLKENILISKLDKLASKKDNSLNNRSKLPLSKEEVEKLNFHELLDFGFEHISTCVSQNLIKSGYYLLLT